MVSRDSTRRHQPLTAWSLLLALLLTPAAAAQAPAGALQAALDALPAGASAALVVADADTGEIAFAANPDAPMKPASVMKLMVTAAALERFGPGFALETRLCVQDDELWLVGGGDPGMGDERLDDRRHRRWDHVLDEWAARVRIAHPGPLRKFVLDDSIYEAQTRHPDWDRNQFDRWYCAPVGGLNYFTNCVVFEVDVQRSQVYVRTTPPIPPTFIHADLQRGGRYRAVLHRPPDSDIFELSGTVVGDGKIGTASVGRPTVFTGHALRLALQKRGVVLDGPVARRELTPAEIAAAQPVATHRTTLPEILWRCNTFSQNAYAESLLKSMAAYAPDGSRSGTTGSWTAGVAVMCNTLEKLGVDMRGSVLRDGSGLSHGNRLTARQIATLLVRMRQHPHAAMFGDSLAEAGEDGTLRKARGEVLKGRLRAKTGTIASVRTLAGYVERDDGRTWAFALLTSGPVKRDQVREVARILAR